MYRLGLLACDFVPEELRESFDDYPVMFDAAIASTGAEVEWSVYTVYSNEFPESPDACDGYLITGSRSGVYDNLAWIPELEKFIRTVRDARVPLVGLCFGHQILAQALGGKAEKSPRGWGIGINQFDTGSIAAWMIPPLQSFQIPVCHQDQVTQLPQGATLLASNAHCKNFVIQFNDTMIGIQGHPEFETRYLETLIDLREVKLDAATYRAARESLTRPSDNLTVMTWITNFLGIA